MSRALYKILVDDILQKIASGDIAVGQRLPPEAEYAETLGVSRSTLRQAFGCLEQSGIIKRRKRGGTEVISSKPVQRFSLVNSGLYDVLSLARDTLLVVTDIREVAAGTDVCLTDVDTTDKRWLVCSGCRYLAGQGLPFAESNVYVPYQYSDFELQVGDTTSSILSKIQDRYGLSAGHIERQISADGCCEKVATKLGLTPGHAVLKIKTKVDDANGDLLEIAQVTIDPSRFNLNIDVVVDG